ncbi:MAG: hypothetical protein JRD19_00895 [Deltaproteobacteria bacterium]|nr:hypothetical protein [Deltaproteobacteria bacterium]
MYFLNLLIALLAGFALSSCTMVSNEMLPGMEYRENPLVGIIEYDDHANLQEDCTRQVKETYLWFSGCSLVPQNPRKKYVIRVTAGDDKNIRHELTHCHGHGDTFLPSMVDYDFYNTPKRS